MGLIPRVCYVSRVGGNLGDDACARARIGFTTSACFGRQEPDWEASRTLGIHMSREWRQSQVCLCIPCITLDPRNPYEAGVAAIDHVKVID